MMRLTGVLLEVFAFAFGRMASVRLSAFAEIVGVLDLR
jgi:hypothetical protein